MRIDLQTRRSAHFTRRRGRSGRAWLVSSSVSTFALGLLSALAFGCADRGEGDSVRTLRVPVIPGLPRGGASADAPEARADAPGLASPGSQCENPGSRACWKNGSKLALKCNDDSWEVDSICDDDERCETAEGEQQGLCLPIVAECEDQQPGQAFCADDALRSCTDLVSFEDTACGSDETCSGEAPSVSCVCKTGFGGSTGACFDIDECAIQNGGCDEGTPCQNMHGSYTCGGCPAGYVGGRDGRCTPSLTGLVVSPDELEPAFDTIETKYALAVPITMMTIGLKPSAPEKATIRINGDKVRAGRTWRSELLARGENAIELSVSEGERERRYEIVVTRGSGEETYLKAVNPDANDNFGTAIAISGDTMVIGAPSEDSSATGTFRGDDVALASANNMAQNAGAAYVFVHDEGAWQLEAYLKASNAAAGFLFGTAVGIVGDTVVIGSPGEASAANPDATAFASGAAYVFTRRRGRWSEQARLKAANAGAGDYFGSVVAISDEAIVVGAPGEASSLTGINGAPDNNGAYGSGAAYVFVRDDDGFRQHSYLKAERSAAGDSFGWSVAISGDTIVIGAIGEDGGDNVINGDPQRDDAEDSGAAYAFLRDNDAWYQDAYFKSSGNQAGASFGYSVAAGSDTVVIGAPGSSQGDGAAYVFVREGGTWSEQAALAGPVDPEAQPMPSTGQPGGSRALGDAYGAAVRIAGETILIGAYGEDSDLLGFNSVRSAGANDDAPNSGAAYSLFRQREQWSASDYIKPTNTRPNQQFGSRVAVSTDTIAVGSMNDGTNPRDMTQDPAELGPPNSGSVYVFR
jgi:hypothetical protein